MVYDNGIKRPLVRAPNSAGVQRIIKRYYDIDNNHILGFDYTLCLDYIFIDQFVQYILSALEGVCHQLGTKNAFDIGSPTYFRKSIASDGGTGNNSFPP